MSWLVVAWRNLWRNRRRTAVTLATIAACTGVLILFEALMIGMIQGNVDNLTDVQLGQVQVHHAEYRKRPSMYRDIADAEEILRWADDQGLGAVPRSFGAGLVGHEQKSSGAQIWGLDPERERRAFELAGHLRDGEFIDSSDPTGAAIGAKLARSIEARVGDELIVVVAAADGSIGNELWHVRGILKPLGEQIDRSAVMIPQAAFEEIFVSGGRVHQIALSSRPGPGDDAAALATSIDAAELARRVAGVAGSEDEVASWRELLPTMSEMVDMSDRYNEVFALIFFMAAALGILNTMLMAAYERIPEMGLVKALGASPLRIFSEMMLEVVLLSGLGSVVGMVLGALATIYFQINGIDTSSWGDAIEVSGVVWDPVWRTRFDPAAVIGAPLSLLPIALLAGFYPAWSAARVVPVQALRRMT